MDLNLVLFVLLLAVAVLEIIFYLRWTPSYFNSGLIIFRKSFQRRDYGDIDLSYLEEEMNKSIFLSGMLFKKQSDKKIFFREPLFEFKFLQYSTLMHGVIIEGHNSITVLGRANWFPIVFLIAVLLFVGDMEFQSIKFIFLAFAIFILFIIYLVQSSRYKKIVDLLRT